MECRSAKRTVVLSILVIVAVVGMMVSTSGVTMSDDGGQCAECSARPATGQVLHSSSAPGYCESHGGNQSYEYILDGNYTHLTEDTISITVEIFIANPAGCTSGNPCPSYDGSPEYINGWIDWDGDKTFESSERVLDAALTGYLGINYYGTMTTSTIVSVPADAGNITWMRINLGWDHDPNDPCESSWTWGDIRDWVVATRVSVPTISEIKVTGIPNAKNPMTNDASVTGVEKVKLEATIAPADGFEVTKVAWSGDIQAGEGNPYEYIPSAGSHGMKYVMCAITYKETSSGETWTDTKGRNFKLFFPKKSGTGDYDFADDDSDGLPNWFEYWKSDGAVPDMAPAIYNASASWYGMSSGGKIYLGPPAANQHYGSAITLNTFFGTESFGGPAVKGVDSVAEVIAHELYHKWVDDQWLSGGSFNGQTDSDVGLNEGQACASCNDSLPDFYENNTSHTYAGNDTDTYDLEHKKHPDYKNYGDNEYMAMRTANGARGTVIKDWANPGKQSDPPYGCESYGDLEAVNAAFTGKYFDQGLDIDSDAQYDYLRVLAEVEVAAGGPFTVVGKLSDKDGNEITFVNMRLLLYEGTQSIALDFKGLSIRQHGVDGPYKVTLLLGDQEGNEIDYRFDTYTTASYSSTDFERKDVEFSKSYSDMGMDTNADGLYDILRTGIGVNVVTSGRYTIEAGLYDSNDNAIELVANSGFLSAGAQWITLDFDGLKIGRNRIDGPYYLKYLSIGGSPQIDFIKDAYTTASYSYANFEMADAIFSGIYSDHGVDTDSDGLYNDLVIDVGVNVTTAGQYTVVGWLHDLGGNPIVEASNSSYLNTGSQQISLNFDGASIYLHGVNGFYDLKYLTLYDDDGKLMDTLNNAYQTAYYAYSSFEVPLIGLTGTYSDYGSDTDSDGKFEYLTVEMGVVVADPGYCLVKARLVDSSGNEILWAETIAHITTIGSPQIIKLDFDGEAIYDHGVNGPYYLQDIYLYHTGDPFKPYYIHEAHTTNAYDYCDFGDNCPPIADANGSYEAKEGSTVTLDGTGSFDPEGGSLSYMWDLDNNGTFETSGSTPPFYGEDGPLTWPVNLQVCDDAPLCATDSNIVVIANVSPTVVSITAPTDPVKINTPISVSASFTDPGKLDTHTAVWAWEDGSTSAGNVSEANGSGSASGIHTYTKPGVYTITLTVIDKDGGFSQALYEYVVIYDPDGGFVTGGGWINSPPGAYPANPKLTGKAIFGFVSKYPKGGTIPTGNTEFQFHAADLNFHATSFQWLVVSGTKAMYKGYGTKNGEGGYSFLLSAIDGDAKKSSSKDKFRIKIWDTESGIIVYDNQKGAPETANPTTPIAGGSITIHAP